MKPSYLTAFSRAGWDVLAATDAPKGRLGVAVLAQRITVASNPLQLQPEWFEVGEVYPELAEWFAERSVAVDVEIGGTTLRFGSFHATPGKSKGPRKMGVGRARKPWFHRRIADWIAEWPHPYAFAVDANSPKTETIDSVNYFIARGEWCEAGEDDLLGIRSLGNPPRHDADDLLRTWLRSPHGATRLKETALDGPLWASHYPGGKARRFDHIWATPQVEPRTVKHWPLPYPLDAASISDHAIVGALVTLPPSAVE